MFDGFAIYKSPLVEPGGGVFFSCSCMFLFLDESHSYQIAFGNNGNYFCFHFFGNGRWLHFNNIHKELHHRIEAIGSIGVVLNIALVDVFVCLIPVIALQQVFYNVISSLFVAVKLFVATCK